MTEQHFKDLRGETVFAVLSANGKMRRVYWFKLPVRTDAAYYNTVKSCAAFAQRGRTISSPITCQVYLENDSMLALELSLGIYSNLPTSYLASLWDFYKEIGYDYAKRRYSKSATDF